MKINPEERKSLESHLNLIKNFRNYSFLCSTVSFGMAAYFYLYPTDNLIKNKEERIEDLAELIALSCVSGILAIAGSIDAKKYERRLGLRY